MGSEMCIRDSSWGDAITKAIGVAFAQLCDLDDTQGDDGGRAAQDYQVATNRIAPTKMTVWASKTSLSL